MTKIAKTAADQGFSRNVTVGENVQRCFGR
jgi:hypothetical protein